MARSEATVEHAAAMVRAARRVAVLTGAGISTAAGIPDFRGPDGVWTRNPAAERASNIATYLADPEIRRVAWQRRLHLADLAPTPTIGHRALLTLERDDRLVGLATQNIDGLHHDVGHDPGLVHEVHGTGRVSECTRCGDRRPTAEILDRVRAGEDDPACERCGGILKPAVVFFGENLPAAAFEAAFEAAQRCDLLLTVGTTLAVHPICRMVDSAKAARAQVVIVNGGPTERDVIADLVVRATIDEVLPTIVGADPS